MSQKQFTVEELHELEELQIMGGKGPDNISPQGQGGCKNEATGCGAGVDQTGCTNSVGGCGSTLHLGCPKPEEWM